jgi:hypothetical protein
MPEQFKLGHYPGPDLTPMLSGLCQEKYGGEGGTAQSHHFRHGAEPSRQRSSRWILSRSVSIGCQKPEC